MPGLPSHLPRDPVDELAEEFAARLRRGEQPSIEDYAQQLPQQAEKIRRVFSALIVMERFKPKPDDESNVLGTNNGAASPRKVPKQIGDYRVLREVGRGGMGIVYEAEQTSLGRHVALKVLNASAVMSSKHIARFERESRAAAQLHHTNIVPVFGVGREGDLHYYVMQFIPGQPLDDVLDELKWLRKEQSTGDMLSKHGSSEDGQPTDQARSRAAQIAVGLLSGDFGGGADGPALPESLLVPAPVHHGRPESPSDSSAVLPGATDVSSVTHSDALYFRCVARVGLQVAEALAYAHQQGILHRDIKPGNLLLDHHGTVWVTDFGLARFAEEDKLTETGDIVGTLRYMPPEAFRGKYDIRSDVFGLGLTLYEMIALRPAFDAIDRSSLMRQVASSEMTRLRKVNPSVPRDLETIVMKSLEHEPAHRYANGRRVAEDLLRFLDDKPIHARRTNSIERVWRWSHRNPVFAASVVAVAALLMFMAVAGQVVANRQTEAREITEEMLLVADTYSSAQARENSDLVRMSQGLERHRSEELGGFALDYLREQYRSALRQTRLRHENEVYSVVFSPDGTTLITSTEDTIRLWDLATRKVLVSRTRQSDRPTRLAISPDGRALASASRRGQVTLWDLPTLQERMTFLGLGGMVEELAFSPDGTTLAVTGWGKEKGEGGLTLWDVKSGDQVYPQMHMKKEGLAVTFSPDSKMVVVGGFGCVHRWELPSLKAAEPLSDDNSYVRCVAISGNGSLLAMGGDESVVRLYDLSRNQLRVVLEGHLAPINRGAFSPDGRLFATASADRTVRLWHVETGRKTATLRGHTRAVRCLAFSPDGTILASGSNDHNVILWDTSRANPGLLKLHKSHVQGLVFSNDSTKLVSVGRKHPSLVVWDVATERGEVLTQGDLSIQSAAISPINNMLATNLHSSLKIWDMNAGTGTVVGALDNIISSLAFSPNGKMLACATLGTVKVFNTETWKQITPEAGIIGPQQWTTNVAFSRNNGLFATPTGDNKATVYETKSWEPVEGLSIEHTYPITDVAFSPDGRTLATACEEGKIRLWDLNAKAMKDELVGESSGLYCLAFSPDGMTLVSGGVDSRINIWNLSLRRPQLVATLKGHTSSVRRAIFSSDGTILATASYDGTVRLWRAPRGDESTDFK